jgi:hypothetical protein
MAAAGRLVRLELGDAGEILSALRAGETADASGGGDEGLKPRWRGLGLGAGSRGLGVGVAAASTGACPEASPTTTLRLPENRAKPLCARGKRRRVVGHSYW